MLKAYIRYKDINIIHRCINQISNFSGDCSTIIMWQAAMGVLEIEPHIYFSASLEIHRTHLLVLCLMCFQEVATRC